MGLKMMETLTPYESTVHMVYKNVGDPSCSHICTSLCEMTVKGNDWPLGDGKRPTTARGKENVTDRWRTVWQCGGAG